MPEATALPHGWVPLPEHANAAYLKPEAWRNALIDAGVPIMTIKLPGARPQEYVEKAMADSVFLSKLQPAVIS